MHLHLLILNALTIYLYSMHIHLLMLNVLTIYLYSMYLLSTYNQCTYIYLYSMYLSSILGILKFNFLAVHLYSTYISWHICHSCTATFETSSLRRSSWRPTACVWLAARRSDVFPQCPASFSSCCTSNSLRSEDSRWPTACTDGPNSSE